MDNEQEAAATVSDMPNPNNLERWVIPPPYGVRFVVDMQSKLLIEFAPGREEEIHAWLLQHIDFNLNQKRAKIQAMKAEAARAKLIEAARVKRDASMGVVPQVVHQSEAVIRPHTDTSGGNPIAGLADED